MSASSGGFSDVGYEGLRDPCRLMPLGGPPDGLKGTIEADGRRIIINVPETLVVRARWTSAVSFEFDIARHDLVLRLRDFAVHLQTSRPVPWTDLFKERALADDPAGEVPPDGDSLAAGAVSAVQFDGRTPPHARTKVTASTSGVTVDGPSVVLEFAWSEVQSFRIDREAREIRLELDDGGVVDFTSVEPVRWHKVLTDHWVREVDSSVAGSRTREPFAPSGSPAVARTATPSLGWLGKVVGGIAVFIVCSVIQGMVGSSMFSNTMQHTDNFLLETLVKMTYRFGWVLTIALIASGIWERLQDA